MKKLAYLQIGDVFEIKEGMRIYVQLPEYFAFIDDGVSKEKLVDKDIKVGEIIRKGNDSYDTAPYAGEYVVELACFGGGGQGHGPNDEYRDGWHVQATQLKNGNYDPAGRTISFYQSGAFTATIEPKKVPVLREMKKAFI